jgi:RHS repeat-associated protein
VVGAADLAGTTKSEYIFFGVERVARRDGATGTGGVFYYFSDHLNTASVITDSAGVIKAESDYYPWGGELQFVNNDSNDYKFTGKKRDSETGLDYFGARFYSNGLGRWVSADWSAAPVPVPYANFGDPQSLNLYGFVGGNPASKADLDGHCDGVCWVMSAIQYVSAHAGVTGIGIDVTRQAYNQKATELKASGATKAERDASKLEFREKGPALGRELAKQEAADPARIAARAAKSDAQLAESVGRTSTEVTEKASNWGKVGKVGTTVAVGIAVYNVATAPPGEKLGTAKKEVGGLAGAAAGGEAGAIACSGGGAYGAGACGIAGAIAGGFGGSKLFDNTNSVKTTTPPTITKEQIDQLRR